jgi:hypothetical protein
MFITFSVTWTTNSSSIPEMFNLDRDVAFPF